MRENRLVDMGPDFNTSIAASRLQGVQGIRVVPGVLDENGKYRVLIDLPDHTGRLTSLNSKAMSQGEADALRALWTARCNEQSY